MKYVENKLMRLTKKELCDKVIQLGMKCVELELELENKYIKPIPEEGIFQLDEVLDLGGNIIGDPITFTGQHRNLANSNVNRSHTGLIVESNGDYINLSNSIRPTINEALAYVKVCDTDKSKRIFGVISDKEDNGQKRIYENGVWGSIMNKTNVNEDRLYINSLGEGSVWVCNKNGNLQNGDYITSSSVVGYGMKQDDDLLHNYTLGKITCDCDFSLSKVVKKKVRTSTDASGNSELVYDISGGMEYEDDLDASGNQQLVYQYDTRLLDAQGNQVSEGEHTSIANFVGCTYHCG